MTRNTWQKGLYGNFSDPRDEQVRDYLDAIEREYDCSSSEAIKIAALRAYAATNAHMNEDEPIRETGAYAPDDDTRALLRDIREAVQWLVSEMKRLQKVDIAVQERTQQGIELPEAFLADIRRNAKPGIGKRLEQ